MTKIIFLFSVILMFSAAFLKAQIIIAPDDLKAEAQDSSYIKIKWHDNSSNEEGFYIERAEINNSASWEIIDAVPQNVKKYMDYWVTRGRTYYYRVFAYKGAIRSGYSNIDSAVLDGDPKILPPPPSNLMIKNITSTSITIRWQDNSTNEYGFIIARKNQDEPFFRYIDTVATDILTYQEVGLTPDNVYIYKVCAYNSAGISDYSNSVSGRTELLANIFSNGETPDNPHLENNYPNPFNPTTNIKFGITSNSFVKITIYNSLGKEVENLINQNLSPGTFTVAWDGQRFTSGVYFYKLSATGVTSNTEQFTAIKKMLLIK